MALHHEASRGGESRPFPPSHRVERPTHTVQELHFGRRLFFRPRSCVAALFVRSHWLNGRPRASRLEPKRQSFHPFRPVTCHSLHTQEKFLKGEQGKVQRARRLSLIRACPVKGACRICGLRWISGER